MLLQHRRASCLAASSLLQELFCVWCSCILWSCCVQCQSVCVLGVELSCLGVTMGLSLGAAQALPAPRSQALSAPRHCSPASPTPLLLAPLQTGSAFPATRLLLAVPAPSRSPSVASARYGLWRQVSRWGRGTPLPLPPLCGGRAPWAAGVLLGRQRRQGQQQ